MKLVVTRYSRVDHKCVKNFVDSEQFKASLQSVLGCVEKRVCRRIHSYLHDPVRKFGCSALRYVTHSGGKK